ncbi:MAG: META domain-containing protein [Candidatus Nanopelagicales bacterium]
MSPLRLRTTLIASAVAAGCLIVLAACGSASAPEPAADGGSLELAGSTWVLESYAGPDGAATPAVAEGDIGSLAFDASGGFSGSTGCNRIAGTYTQGDTSLTMQPGPMTLMACQGPAEAQESAVVAALPLVASFASGDTLALLDDQGQTLLTYSPGMTDVAGTSWQATGVNNGKEAVVGLAGTSAITADFGTDGTLSGSGGCNTYSADFSTSGTDQITIGIIASTLMACPDDVMQSEQEYFTALGKVTTFQIDGATLTLRDDEGQTQVTLALVP